MKIQTILLILKLNYQIIEFSMFIFYNFKAKLFTILRIKQQTCKNKIIIYIIMQSCGNKQQTSDFRNYTYLKHYYIQRRGLSQAITFFLAYFTFFCNVRCQQNIIYNPSFNYLARQPRFQTVSPDGLYFVTSYQNQNSDHLKIFKAESQGFSLVSDIQLHNTRISDMKISNQGQKIAYVDFKSDKVRIHTKRVDGSFQSQADQQISIINGPNSVDISADGNLLVIVGNDTLVKIYKTNGRFSPYVLFQTINIVNEVSGQEITSSSNFYTCSLSRDMQSLVISGQAGEIYVYELNVVNYAFFQKISSSAGSSNHTITYSLKLNFDGTVMIAGTNMNFLSFYRTGKGQHFSIPSIYNNCFAQKHSAFAVTVADSGDTFYASCYYPSPTHIFKRQKNSTSIFALSKTILSTVDVYSISVSADGAYLVIGDNGAQNFTIFQFFCGSGKFFNQNGVCESCDNVQCDKCSRFQPDKCFSCSDSLNLIQNSCKNCSFYGQSCLACTAFACTCDSSNDSVYQLECQNCQNYTCKQRSITEVSWNTIIPVIIAVPLGIVILIAAACLVRKYIQNRQVQPYDIRNAEMADSFYNFGYIGQSGEINKFPQNPQKIFVRSKSLEQGEEYEVCSICLIGDVTHFTPCFHYFHSECIKAWIAKQKKCPNCRLPIHLRDIFQLKEQRK